MRPSPRDVATKRILLSEVKLDEPLVGHHYGPGPGRVPLVDFPAEKHRNLHRREESRPGVENPCLLGYQVPRDAELQPSSGGEKRRMGQRRIANARNGGESLAQFL